MDKLTMAHDWYLKHAGGASGHMDLEVDLAWQYADRMQAEADKRGKVQHSRSGYTITTHNNLDVLRDEWQPDWSQAPDGFDWFAMDGVGAFWYRNMPNWDGEEWSNYKDDREGSSTEPTMPFGYKGRYIDSLRKRTEVK